MSEEKTSLPSSALSFSPLPPLLNKRQRLGPIVGILTLMLGCMVIGGFFGYMVAISNVNATLRAQQAKVVTATATSLAGASNPYVPGAHLALADPLSWPGAWQPASSKDATLQCQFLGIGYQINSSEPGFYSCDEGHVYQNFVFEVKMTINQGDCGGMIFRSTSNDFNMYRFLVCQDGWYHFFTYISTDPSATKPITLKEAPSASIRRGSELNKIAVVADGSRMDLYVNGLKIDSIIDTSHTQGTLGLFAQDAGSATTVTYSDARIWTIQ